MTISKRHSLLFFVCILATSYSFSQVSNTLPSLNTPSFRVLDSINASLSKFQLGTVANSIGSNPGSLSLSLKYGKPQQNLPSIYNFDFNGRSAYTGQFGPIKSWDNPHGAANPTSAIFLGITNSLFRKIGL